MTSTSKGASDRTWMVWSDLSVSALAEAIPNVAAKLINQESAQIRKVVTI